MSLYTDLGVAEDADAETIRAAHRRLAKQHHPDRGGNREDFDRVQNAYLILRDPVTRKRYDETGEAETAPNNELTEIANLLSQCFDQATATCGGMFDTTDLVKAMRTALAERKRNARTGLVQLGEGVRTIERIRKRLSYSGDGNDLLGGMLNSRMQENERAQAAVNAEIASIERAEAYAFDYGYDFDPTPTHKPGEWHRAPSDFFR